MFELANPWVLLLLPLPVLFWYCLPRAQILLNGALQIPFFDALLPIVEQERRSIPTHSLVLFPLIIWLLLLLGLAGPRWIGDPLPLKSEGYNIMLALDLSGSMEVTDMLLHGRPVSRLAVVKRAAEQFVEDRSGDRIGLILFGTQAYLQTPLTYDRHSVLLRIEDATAGLAGKTTSIGDAVGLAVKRFQDIPQQGRVLILLTDGANTSGVLSPLKAAELAKEDSIKIYTIGLGSESDPKALTMDNFMNFNPSADLDEETLQKMAEMTGGRYFRATDPQSLESIYKTINQLETIQQEQATIRPQHEYYPYCVGLALMLSFYWILRQSAVAGIIRILVRGSREART